MRPKSKTSSAACTPRFCNGAAPESGTPSPPPCSALLTHGAHRQRQRQQVFDVYASIIGATTKRCATHAQRAAAVSCRAGAPSPQLLL